MHELTIGGRQAPAGRRQGRGGAGRVTTTAATASQQLWHLAGALVHRACPGTKYPVRAESLTSTLSLIEEIWDCPYTERKFCEEWGL